MLTNTEEIVVEAIHRVKAKDGVGYEVTTEPLVYENCMAMLSADPVAAVAVMTSQTAVTAVQIMCVLMFEIGRGYGKAETEIELLEKLGES